MPGYTITTDNGHGIDIVTVTDPCAAIDIIQDARADGWVVIFTGDPFGDFAKMNEEDL